MTCRMWQPNFRCVEPALRPAQLPKMVSYYYSLPQVTLVDIGFAHFPAATALNRGAPMCSSLQLRGPEPPVQWFRRLRHEDSTSECLSQSSSERRACNARWSNGATTMIISSSRVPLVSWRLAKPAESNEKAVGVSRGTHGAFRPSAMEGPTVGRARTASRTYHI